MILTPPNISLFFTMLDSRFWQGLQLSEEWSPAIASDYPVTTEQWLEGYMDMIDGYREWIGPRKTKQPAPLTFSAPIKKWELTQELDRAKIEDDTYGIYFPLASFMGMQAKKVYDYKLRDLLFQQGAYASSQFQVCVDGTNYFSGAHPVDYWDASKGTYANDARGGGYTENGQTVGGTFSVQAYNSLWASQASRKAANGEAMGVLPDMTVGAPQTKAARHTVIQSQIIGFPQIGTVGSGTGANAPMVGTTDNPLRGWTDDMTVPDFAAQPLWWWMLHTKGPIKPFSRLMRIAPDLIPRTSPNDPNVFNKDKLLFGSRARFGVTYSLPFLASVSGP